MGMMPSGSCVIPARLSSRKRRGGNPLSVRTHALRLDSHFRGNDEVSEMGMAKSTGWNDESDG
jgi:hypothetical protein